MKSSLRMIVPIMVFTLALTTTCTKHTAKRAGEGAATGALVGAVGGLVTGLVFGGNALESAAHGAVYGGSTGATAGALAGAKEESANKERERAQVEALRKKIGEDAFNGLMALVNCKHGVAIANAQVAQKDQDKNKALAGLWLEMLTFADSKEEAKAREMYPQIVEKDDKISTTDEAETRLREAIQKLMDIREEHGLPKVCS